MLFRFFNIATGKRHSVTTRSFSLGHQIDTYNSVMRFQQFVLVGVFHRNTKGEFDDITHKWLGQVFRSGRKLIR